MSKSIVNNENYYVVQGWMRNVLGLRGNALDIYAIIYGFSQVSHQEFTASINYLCEWLGVSRPTVINTLKDLVDNGYLTKESNEINGVIYNRYTAVVPDFTGGKKILLPSKKTLLPSKEILPNNIDNNIDNNIENSLSKDKEEQAPETKQYKSYGEIYTDPINSDIRIALEKFVKSLSAKHGYKPKVTTVAKFADTLRNLSSNNFELAMRIVDQSIDKGWKDLYKIKDKHSRDAVSVPFNPEKDTLATDTAGKTLVY